MCHRDCCRIWTDKRDKGFALLAIHRIAHLREARLCERHAQPLATLFEHKRREKGLNSMEEVCYNGRNQEPLANGLLIELPARLRERWRGKEAFRV